MIAFDNICNDFEQMTADQRGLLLEKTVNDLMPRLEEVTADALSATTLFGLFVTGAIMADNELSTDEYELMKNGYEALGLKTTFSECENMLKLSKITMDAVVGSLSSVLSDLDDDTVGDLLLVCLTLCSIDGEINAAEKEWIEKLFAD